MTEKDTGTSFIIGFLVGAAAGAAIGFLYAPKPGAETRALLKEKAAEAERRAAETTRKAREAAARAEKRVEEKLHHKPAEAEEE